MSGRVMQHRELLYHSVTVCVTLMCRESCHESTWICLHDACFICFCFSKCLFDYSNIRVTLSSHHSVCIASVVLKIINVILGCPQKALQFNFHNKVGSLCKTVHMEVNSLITIGLDRIFSGVHFFLKKVDDFILVVALKTQAKTTKWTTPTLQISPSRQKMY